MGELLTTGEMIDRLKVGEVAEVANKPFEQLETKGKTVAYDQQCIKWQDSFQELFINSYTTKLMWTIRPKYVSFEEAMKAVSEGKTAVMHRWGKQKTYFNKDGAGAKVKYEFNELLNGKWTIEEANNESKYTNNKN